jgi:hypothetical protein
LQEYEEVRVFAVFVSQVSVRQLDVAALHVPVDPLFF